MKQSMIHAAVALAMMPAGTREAQGPSSNLHPDKLDKGQSVLPRSRPRPDSQAKPTAKAWPRRT
jgi:hypothetical protein